MLAWLAARHPCELRADFQQYYGLNVDGMGTDYTVFHAADLAVMLPQGSRCARAANPQLGLSNEAVLLNAVEYRLQQIVYSLSGGKAADGSRLPKPEPLFKPGKKEPDRGMDIDEMREFLSRPRTVDNGN